MTLLGQTPSYPSIDGFLGARGSLMLDVVFLAMFAVLPILAVSIWLVKRGHFQAHKRIQVALGIVLLVSVVAFEVDIRLMDFTEVEYQGHSVNGWEIRALESPYFDPAAKWTCVAGVSLIIHLFFAVPTAALWVYVIVMALRKFPSPPLPSAYSHSHKFWGWLAALEMTFTALTGWIFYYLAFVATK